MFKDSHDGLDALNKRLLAECNGLKSLMSKPLSVYFTAYRAEDYIEGGEAYLTFQGIKYFMLESILKQVLHLQFTKYLIFAFILAFLGMHCNLGGGMDAKSGVFTAPVAGSYLFTIHACTHDMHKALLSIRHNGNQVNHIYFLHAYFFT